MLIWLFLVFRSLDNDVGDPAMWEESEEGAAGAAAAAGAFTNR